MKDKMTTNQKPELLDLEQTNPTEMDGTMVSSSKQPYVLPAFRVEQVELEQSMAISTLQSTDTDGVLEETTEESIDDDSPFTII